MIRTTLLFAAAFIGVGVFFCMDTGRESVTALIPAFIGVALAICSLLGRNPKLSMHVMRVAVLLSVATAGMTLRRPGVPRRQPGARDRCEDDHLSAGPGALRPADPLIRAGPKAKKSEAAWGGAGGRAQTWRRSTTTAPDPKYVWYWAAVVLRGTTRALSPGCAESAAAASAVA